MFPLLVSAVSSEIVIKVPTRGASYRHDSNNHTEHVSLQPCSASSVQPRGQVTSATLPLSEAANLLLLESVIWSSIISFRILKGTQILKNSSESSMVVRTSAHFIRSAVSREIIASRTQTICTLYVFAILSRCFRQFQWIIL